MTSGLRSDIFRTPGVVFQHYEQLKRDYKHTADSCKAAGFCFTPMVMEAHGGG